MRWLWRRSVWSVASWAWITHLTTSSLITHLNHSCNQSFSMYNRSKSVVLPLFLSSLAHSLFRELCFSQKLITIHFPPGTAGLVCVCVCVHLCFGVCMHIHMLGKLIPLDIDHPVSLLVYCIHVCVCVCVFVCMHLCVSNRVVIRLVARGNRNGCFQKWLSASLKCGKPLLMIDLQN